MLKQIAINCITMILLTILLTCCLGQTKEKAFIAKYKFEDFSQFNDVSVFIRGLDVKKNPIVFINAPNIVYDTLRGGLYVVTINKQNHQIIKAKWTLTEVNINADTIKLQQLVQKFMNYEIQRLNVDKDGNVFVYLKDIETLALVRFANESELQKWSKKVRWIKVKDNWYKPDA